jgi:tRNA A37 threonylcarbamoyladenosine synthetase subunit TsaC/SUA5/YrdC
MDQLGGRIALVLDGGRTPGGLASTVVDCTGSAPVILRQGPLSLEELLAVL